MTVANVALCAELFVRPAPPSATLLVASAVAGWAVARFPVGAMARGWSRLKILIASSSTDRYQASRQISVITSRQVKEALVNLALPGTPITKSLNLRLVPYRNDSQVTETRAALERAISELVGSAEPRKAEAGRVLHDYYVKRVGSHEMVMERLYLSRPTFYRRLRQGLELVAERLNEVNAMEPKAWNGV